MDHVFVLKKKESMNISPWLIVFLVIVALSVIVFLFGMFYVSITEYKVTKLRKEDRVPFFEGLNRETEFAR